MTFLLDELEQLLAAFESEHIEYAVCGGVALTIHGFPRATMDIDILIREDSLSKTTEIAERCGFIYRGLNISFDDPRLEIRRISKIIDGVLLCLDLLLVIEEFETVWETKERVRFAGREISVVSRDGLIFLKRHAGRPQDLADIHRIENEES